MANGLKSLIYRERKRLTFVTALAFLAGVVLYLRSDITHVGSVPVPLLTGIIYAAIIGPTALFFCLFLPSIRFMIEAIAVSRLVFAFFVFFVPEVGYQVLASPFATATVVVVGGFFVSRMIHGRLLKAKTTNLAAWFVRARNRTPARLRGNNLQHRFVGWIDDTQPIAA